MRGPKIMVAVVVLAILFTLVYCLRCSIQAAWGADLNPPPRQQAVDHLLRDMSR
ncbi:MAG: hypothetical protein ACE15C_16330 [Phycisphaerae bacterium]